MTDIPTDIHTPAQDISEYIFTKEEIQDALTWLKREMRGGVDAEEGKGVGQGAGALQAHALAQQGLCSTLTLLDAHPHFEAMVIASASDPAMWRAIIQSEEVRRVLKSELSLLEAEMIDIHGESDGTHDVCASRPSKGNAIRALSELLSSTLGSVWLGLQKMLGFPIRSHDKPPAEGVSHSLTHDTSENTRPLDPSSNSVDRCMALTLLTIFVALGVRLKVVVI